MKRVKTMDHYLDIKILPDPEFAVTQLMNALFSKLHRALAQLQCDAIGISFPLAKERKFGLGSCLRLHGDSQAISLLMERDWLVGMKDHLIISSTMPVPADASHQTVRRVQAKSNVDRLRRRQMKRKGLTVEQAREAIPDSAAEMLRLPFITLRSSSTEQSFRLFVEQKHVQAPIPGSFNSYGISSTATVPHF